MALPFDGRKQRPPEQVADVVAANCDQNAMRATVQRLIDSVNTIGA